MMIATEGTSILLIEDNPDDVELTLHALESQRRAGRVVVAKDGAEALTLLTAEAGAPAGMPLAPPRLILLDIHLPKLSGLEVLKRLRGSERTRLVPVVMLTTSNDQRDVAASYALGANSCIRKPTTYDAFIAAVKELVHYWLDLNQSEP